MPPAGFEPAIPAGERPQTLALDRSATGIGSQTQNSQSLVYRGDKNVICSMRINVVLFTNTMHYLSKMQS